MRILYILTIMFIVTKSYSQVVYIDAITPAAFAGYSGTIRSAQDKSTKHLSNIEKAQVLAGSQLLIANQLHNKMLRGLSEVSGTLSNGLTVIEIKNEIKYTLEYLGEAVRLSANQPALLLVSREALSDFRTRTVLLSGQIVNIVSGGENNLMTAGERQKLLDAVHIEVKLLASSAYGIKNAMYWASKVGIWNTLNPFKEYINYDRIIMQDIIRKSQMF